MNLRPNPSRKKTRKLYAALLLPGVLGCLVWQLLGPSAPDPQLPAVTPQSSPAFVSSAAAAEDADDGAGIAGPVNDAPVAPLTDPSALRPSPVNPSPAWVGLPPGAVWRIPANTDGADYIVSFDELYLPTRSDLADNALRLDAPAADLPALLEVAADHTAPATGGAGDRSSGVQPHLVLYPAGSARSPASRLLVTMQVWVETDTPAASAAVASRAGELELGLGELRPVPYSEGAWLADVTGDPAQPLRAAAALSGMEGVRLAMPMLASRMSPAADPDDPLFSRQWHLFDYGQQGGKGGNDINVRPAWNLGYTGAESGIAGVPVRIGIVDDGLQMAFRPSSDKEAEDWPYLPEVDHPDLMDNLGGKHHDWIAPLEAAARKADPQYQFVTPDEHGTAVAGLAAARGNNGKGVTGVAPRASLTRLRILGHDKVTPAMAAEALLWDCPKEDLLKDEATGIEYPPPEDVIHIKNNSWSYKAPTSSDWLAQTTYKAILDALATGTRKGRFGSGTLFVFSSGNHQSVNPGVKNPIAAGSMYAFPVGATDNKGRVADFSQGGPHLLVSAPGDAQVGVVTTDRTGARGYHTPTHPTLGQMADLDYTAVFNGTSSAAPIVSGVVALMLEANPYLGWRDVKEILLRTSTRISASSWVTRDGGQPGLPPIKHSESAGGGLVNAGEAVKLAREWINLPDNYADDNPENNQYINASFLTTGAVPIPDKGSARAVFDFTSFGNNIRVEHVVVDLKIAHPYRGSLTITLRSPSGATSTLLPRWKNDKGSGVQTTLVSVRHWGELSKGKWTLSVNDGTADTRTGSLNASTTLTLYGTRLAAPFITVANQPAALTIVPAGATPPPVLFTGATGNAINYQWRLDNKEIADATSRTLTLSGITVARGGAWTCRVSNLLGATTSDVADVTVYEPRQQTLAAVAGDTYRFPAPVAGAGLKNLAWFRDGKPVLNDNRISGANTTQLVIRNIATADSGAYTLRANAADGTSLNGTAHSIGAMVLTVQPRPGEQPVPTLYGEVGRGIDFPVPPGGVSHAYKGLPKGLKGDKRTGAITGSATTVSSATVTLTVTFADKSKQTVTRFIEIAPSPAIGTFSGYVERSASLNQNLGALLTFTSTAKGAVSGKLLVGKTSASFRSQLAWADGATTSATLDAVLTPRGLPPLALHLDIPQDGSAVAGIVRPAAGGPQATVTAWRNPWDKKIRPATSQAGAYTLVMENPVENTRYPVGYTTASVTTALDGKVKWVLYPADGSPALKGATAISADGTLPLHAVEASPAGSIVGWLRLPDRFAADPVTPGELTWSRAPVAPGGKKGVQSYPEGFDPLPLAIAGAPYHPPAKGQLLFGLVPEDGNTQLILHESESVDFGEQAYLLEGVYFGLWTNNKVRAPKIPLQPKLTLKPATGEFSGSLTLADPDPANPKKTIKRTVKYAGVVMQNWRRGIGYYLIPALPGATPASPLSGEMDYGPLESDDDGD
ncbi:regulatory P domain of subtilisin-like proprotein convertases [Opitutaceae bacterium TAV1]|nr:regulatory P domain of subtilisin-like proprotein convertases [Opitutaceae bacterium TAV1]